MCPAPRCGSGCDRPTDTRVGLPELLAQDVAQRDLEHVVAAIDTLLLDRVDRRIGEEADHRLRARLAALLDLAPAAIVVREADARGP